MPQPTDSNKDVLEKLSNEIEGTNIVILFTEDDKLGHTYEAFGRMRRFYSSSEKIKLDNPVNSSEYGVPPKNHTVIEIPSKNIKKYLVIQAKPDN